jgi:transcriptional regulator with XRE-family HTH domain
MQQYCKKRRLHRNLTQEGLANKSGVSLGSLKRFETTGKIAFESLLKLAVVLECLDDFAAIAALEEKEIGSIDDLLLKKEKKRKQRGTIK